MFLQVHPNHRHSGNKKTNPFEKSIHSRQTSKMNISKMSVPSVFQPQMIQSDANMSAANIGLPGLTPKMGAAVNSAQISNDNGSSSGEEESSEETENDEGFESDWSSQKKDQTL